MNARVGDRVFTPRTGKRVGVCPLWYSRRECPVARTRAMLLTTAFALLVPVTAAAQAIATAGAGGCAAGPASQPPDSRRRVAFPDGDLFQSLLADPKEPRSSFGFLHLRFHASASTPPGMPRSLNVGGVSAGGLAGLWSRRSADRCRGVQVNLIGAIFSQFDLDGPSRDLMNSDFVVGTQISVRAGALSGRVRVYHQSTHPGDDVNLREFAAARVNFGFQAIDTLVAFNHDRWRAYGGGGYLFFMSDGTSSGLAQGGAELRGRRFRGTVRPVAGVDITSLGARSWGLTTSALAGIEVMSPAEITRVRAVVVFADGFIPFGQFAVQLRARTAGLQVQIEF